MQTIKRNAPAPRFNVKPGEVIRMVLAVVVTIVMVFPLYWLLATALKTEEEVMSATITFWPKVMQWENFSYVVNKVPFFKYMLNTAVVTALQMCSELLLGVLAKRSRK